MTASVCSVTDDRADTEPDGAFGEWLEGEAFTPVRVDCARPYIRQARPRSFASMDMQAGRRPIAAIVKSIPASRGSASNTACAVYGITVVGRGKTNRTCDGAARADKASVPHRSIKPRTTPGIRQRRHRRSVAAPSDSLCIGAPAQTPDDVESAYRFASSFGPAVSAIDITRDETAYRTAEELPDMNENAIQVPLSAGALAFKGEKRQERDKEKNRYVSEWSCAPSAAASRCPKGLTGTRFGPRSRTAF